MGQGGGMTHVTLILSGPGTGKTTKLVDVVKRELESGVSPGRVAFVAFTKAAAREAREKAAAVGLDPKELVHFRTIHSACFRALRIRSDDVIRRKHLDELEDLLGDGLVDLLALEARGRATGRGFLAEWEEDDRGISPWVVERAAEAYARFREDAGLVDFTDMLQDYVAAGDPLDVDVAVVDEAQDLSELQWQVVRKMFSTARDLYVAGDDDQAVHLWAGASQRRFMELNPDETMTLPVSHRLSEPVFDLSQEVIARVSQRYPKEVRSGGREGSVEWIKDPFDVDLSEGSWLLLTRTRGQARKLSEVPRMLGIPYTLLGTPAVDGTLVKAILAYEKWRGGEAIDVDAAALVLRYLPDHGLTDGVGVQHPIWHDAMTEIPIEDRLFMIACRRNGEALNTPSRVHVGTIHSSKGREADNVLLMTDLTRKVYHGMRRNEDAEHRVFYVGVTRASQRLHVCLPRNSYGYRM